MTDFEATAIYQPGNSWAAHPWRHEPDAHPSRTGRLTGSGFGAMSLSLSMATAQVFMVPKNGWFLMISQRTSTKWDIMGESFWATPRCDDVHLLAPRQQMFIQMWTFISLRRDVPFRWADHPADQMERSWERLKAISTILATSVTSPEIGWSSRISWWN